MKAMINGDLVSQISIRSSVRITEIDSRIVSGIFGEFIQRKGERLDEIDNIWVQDHLEEL